MREHNRNIGVPALAILPLLLTLTLLIGLINGSRAEALCSFSCNSCKTIHSGTIHDDVHPTETSIIATPINPARACHHSNSPTRQLDLPSYSNAYKGSSPLVYEQYSFNLLCKTGCAFISPRPLITSHHNAPQDSSTPLLALVTLRNTVLLH